jgi:hypothetical protein
MKAGDLVSCWDDGHGPIGVVIELIGQTVRVFIDGKMKYFAGDELWIFYESR